jgi:hypothetical protein
VPGRTLHITRNTEESSSEALFRIVVTGQRRQEEGVGEFSPELLDTPRLRRTLRAFGADEREIRRVLAKLQDSNDAEVELAEPLPGPKIVRAWFDTVINPLLEALRREVELVEGRTWNWRFRPGGLEAICPARQYLGHRTWANLEQLLEFRPGLETKIDQHDDSVAILEQAVRVLYESLVEDPQFKTLSESLLSPESLAMLGVGSPAELFGAYPREDWLKLLAQYTVNNTGLLSPHNTTAKLWNRHRSRFIASLETQGIVDRNKNVSTAAAALSRVDSALVEELKCLRRELSLEYDEPYVLIVQD